MTKRAFDEEPATETEDEEDLEVVDHDEVSDLEARFDAAATTSLSAESSGDPGDVPGTASDAGELAALSSSAVVPLGQDEFVCQRCFLIRNRSQLADAARHICLDCAA